MKSRFFVLRPRTMKRVYSWFNNGCLGHRELGTRKLLFGGNSYKSLHCSVCPNAQCPIANSQWPKRPLFNQLYFTENIDRGNVALAWKVTGRLLLLLTFKGETAVAINTCSSQHWFSYVTFSSMKLNPSSTSCLLKLLFFRLWGSIIVNTWLPFKWWGVKCPYNVSEKSHVFS